MALHDALRAAALLMLLGAVAPAHAQLYVCTDAKGRTITGDRPPPECQDRPVRELRSDGSVRRVIEPPLSNEQKAERAAAEKRQRAEAERQRAQMRRDLALLEAYANEDEIETARNRALAEKQQQIARATKKIEDHKRDRKKLDNEAEFYKGREMPEKLKRSFQINAELLASEERAAADAKADMARVNERYDAELKRFRELVSAGAQPVVRR